MNELKFHGFIFKSEDETKDFKDIPRESIIKYYNFYIDIDRVLNMNEEDMVSSCSQHLDKLKEILKQYKK